MELNAALKPEYISSLKGLALKAKMVLAGTMTGRHLSPYHGFSSEFAQYKGYAPGDDIKHLDWKVFGKNDQLVTRQYRDETNAATYLIIDNSLSMGFGGDGNPSTKKPITKLEYVTVLAASIALMAFGQRDAVSVAYGSNEPTAFLPPRNNAAHLRQAMQMLESIRPSGISDLKSLFGKIATRLKSGSMTFIFTDLWQEPEEIITGLKEIRFKNQSATLVQILTPVEKEFLEGTNMELVDMETDAKLKISARHLKTEYLKTLATHVEKLKSECFNMNVKFVTIDTTSPYFFSMRQILQRG